MTLRALGVDRADCDVKVLELPEPRQPGPGQVSIAVVAAGMGPWDRLLYSGGWDVGLQLPAALGVEGSGSVLAVGPEVTGFQVGDRVLAHEAPLPGGSGFWSEQVLVGAASVAHCPPGLDWVSAAALPIAGLTARQAIDALKIGRGSRLLITGGAGATGAAAVQIAAAAGASVTTTASAQHRDRLTRFGFHSIEQLMQMQGRRLEVIFPRDTDNDLVEDFIAVITSMASRISGRRTSKRRAEKIKQCVEQVMQAEDAGA